MTDTQSKQKRRPRRKSPLNPAHIITLGFLGVILLGAFMLSLPVFSRDHKWMGFLDAIFTATSAVSTTGLLTVGDTATYFNIGGQIVLLILIQFGGVGFMCITTLLMLLVRHKVTLRDRLLMKTEFNQTDNRGMIRLGRNIMLVTLGIEFVGWLLLLYPFVAKSGGIGVWQALFTSVSSFCNAGFDIMHGLSGGSLMGFASDVMVNLSVSLLIVLGGFGFTVLMDIGKNKFDFRKLSYHTKIVLITSGVLIIVGWVFFIGVEWRGTAMSDLSAGGKVLASLFQSVSPRSTGFSTVDQSELTSASKFMTMLLMFIGASPGSTGGGIRTSTFAILILVTISGIRGNNEITVYKRSINSSNARKAVGVFTLSIGVVVLATLIMLIGGTVPGVNPTFEEVLFESMSAYTTAGLSCGVVSNLTAIGKIVLTLLMFFGRVGMATIGLLFLIKRSTDEKITYPEVDLMVG